MARVKEAGDSALLLELDPVIDERVNAAAIAAAAAMREAAVPGVRDVVSTLRSVAVYFDPLAADAALVHAALERAASAPAVVARGRTIEVPVSYGGEDGPDLADVARFASMTPQQVIERHAAAEYRVFMLGFLPGFAYMGPVAPQIAAPRRATPRLRVAAGSVGIAGSQTAVYPRESPGGWQIVGRTARLVFDPARTPAALFSPGDRVRFVPVPPGDGSVRAAQMDRTSSDPGVAGVSRTSGVSTSTRRSVTVLRPGLFTTVQDEGRWGCQASGVPVGGALDLVSLRLANALVGNDRRAAALEATVTGPELRLECAARVAVTGADLGATLDAAPLPLNTATQAPRGSVLRFGERRSGVRAYIAIDGGIDVPPVLGSRSTHVVSALGGVDGRPVMAGDRLPVGPPASGTLRRRIDIPPRADGGAALRVLRGPQDAWFGGDAMEALQGRRFRIAAQSDRMGYRLHGARIPRLAEPEMISDATFPGGIQVPASGEPILLLADRQTTGGYPQIATVITADLPVAAQLAPGDWIEFRLCSRAEAIAALVAQEGKLLALG